MGHPYDPDHGRTMFSGILVTAAFGTPKPRPPRGRPPGNGALGPVKPAPGLGDFGKGGKKLASAKRYAP